MKIRISILSVLLVCTIGIYAQTDNNWVFPNGDGWSFSSVQPSSIPTSINTCCNSGAVHNASISDCEGNILFYTVNGKIWNRDNKLMPNSRNCSTSCGDFDPNLIFPRNDTIYTYHVVYAENQDLYYTQVDMSLDSGRGDLKFQPVKFWDSTFSNKYPAAQHLAVVSHSNGIDYWVVTSNSFNNFMAFLVGPNGIKGRMDSPGPIHWGGLSRIKFSHDGKSLVAPSKDFPANPTIVAYLYDFNNSTGEIDNPKFVASSSYLGIGSQGGVTDFEFSPNDSLIYYTVFRGTSGISLAQVNRYINTLNSTKTIYSISVPSQNPLFSLQLGPDNKIYALGYHDTTVGVIENPDSVGTACNYTRNVYSINKYNDVLFLPNLYRQVYRSSLASNVYSKSTCSDSAYFEIKGDTNFLKYIVYFGNGDSTILTNSQRYTTYRYSQEGNYQVDLVAFTKECNYPIIRTDSVYIKFPPKAKLLTSINKLCNNREIILIDSSLITDSIFTYISPPYSKLQSDSTVPVWVSNNGGTDTVYIDSSANYIFKHIAQNVWGCTDTFTQTLTLAIEPSPTKGFSISPSDFGGCVSHTVTVYDSTKNSTKTTYVWGDGDSLVTASPKSSTDSIAKKYVLAGLFTPKQIVSNNDGCTDTFYLSQAINVVKHPQAGFTLKIDSTCTNITITLTDTSVHTDSISYYSPFAFISPAGVVTSSNILNNGNYIFSQKAWNAYCADSVSIPISLYKKQVPKMDLVANQTAGCVPLQVLITNNQQNTSLRGAYIDFGDGTNSSLFLPPFNFNHTYTDTGSFVIIQIDSALNGCSNADSLTIIVHGKPNIDISLDTNNGCAPVTVNFTNNSSNIIFSFWDFGDGNTSSIPNPTHIYSNAGKYSPKIIAFSGSSCADSIQLLNEIEVFPIPVANFTYSFDNYNAGIITTHFTSQSINANTYLWDFGNGQTSTDSAPSFNYIPNTSSNVLLLITSDKGCTDTSFAAFEMPKFKGLHIPNALHPDYGAFEDRLFKPAGIGLKSYRIRIYDSWGGLIWESDKLIDTQPADGWDGTYPDGTLCPQDVYVWLVYAEFQENAVGGGQDEFGGTYNKRGTVTLLR